jgi:ABC-type transport system involved in cytochrome c biogenesis permease subunit
MKISLLPFLYPWVLLALAVIGLLVWRKAVASHEDDNLHVLDGGGADQTVVAHKLDQIDKWGKILTVIALVYGVILGAAYAYQAWIQTSQSGV